MFYPAEILILAILSGYLIIMLIISDIKGTTIEWLPISKLIFFTIIAIFIAVFIRKKFDFQILAMLILSVATLPAFTSIIAIPFHMFLPLEENFIDRELANLDLLLFQRTWSSSVELLSASPVISQILAQVYKSTILQILTVFFTLALLNHHDQLHKKFLNIIISLIILHTFWINFPSVGTSAYEKLSEVVIEKTNLIVTPELGVKLFLLLTSKVNQIDSDIIYGYVAFPSFHIYLALTCVWCSKGTFLYYPVFLINVLMISATYLHGGHYIVDLLGGVVLFISSTLIVDRLFKLKFIRNRCCDNFSR
jgi:hypothetical protein